MARRTMREHDVVIVDYSDLNAIAIVTDRSEDPKITQGIGGPGVPAFRLQYVAGLTMVEDKVEPAVGFIWLDDDPEHISIVGVNGCLLPSTFYGVDMVQAFRDIGVDCGDGTESDDASSKLISDFISNEPLDQVLSADAWRLDDYPPRRRLDLLARAQKTLEFTDGAREKAADEVATARQAFENACAVLRKRLVWAVWCVAIIPGAYFAIAACRADVETAGRLRGIITLLMAIVFGVLITSAIREGRLARKSRSTLLAALAAQGVQENFTYAQELKIEPILRMIPQEYRDGTQIGAIIELLTSPATPDFAQATTQWDALLHQYKMEQLHTRQGEQSDLRARYEQDAETIRQTDLSDAWNEFDAQEARTQSVRQRNDELRLAIQRRGLEPDTILEKLGHN